MKKIYNIKFFLSLLISFTILSYLYFWFIDNYHNQNIYNNFNKPLIYNPPTDGNDTTFNFLNYPFLDIDLELYQKQNTDTVAYLVVDGTEVNYPVVQTINNEYYLDHDFNKNYNKAGSIFSDYRNKLNNLNKNSIIYGHRRLDNSMFTSLKQLLDKNWFNNQNHHLIYLTTNNRKMLFQIFSVYTIPVENEYLKTHFVNDEFTSFIDTMKKRSLFNFNTSVNELDKILTLSTCLDGLGKNRIVIHSKLIKEENI